MSDVKSVFGMTLRQYRTQQRRTQQEIAERCNMSLRFYQELEAGDKQPTITSLFQLATSLETSPANLIEAAFDAWKAAQ